MREMRYITIETDQGEDGALSELNTQIYGKIVSLQEISREKIGNRLYWEKFKYLVVYKQI